MRESILSHLDDAAYLEALYRKNKSEFKETFKALYPAIENNNAARFWHERLNYESNSIAWGTLSDLIFVVIATLLAGFVAKMPDLFSISDEFFFPRNIGFIVFPFLTAFFIWKNNVNIKTVGILAASLVGSLIFINLLPDNQDSDTLFLACIHLPIFLWMLLGVAFSGNELGNFRQRLEYLRFNGDGIVMIGILAIACGLVTAITFGLFELIGINIEPFFENYLIVFGLPAVPIVATFLTYINPQLVNKVSPIIAKLFSPVVLVMLLVYLGAIIYSGKDPYNDREFLLLFNSLLIGVMALIFFSVAEGSTQKMLGIDFWVIFLLSMVTILVNGIALSAILFRIAEWGFTPNRLAVLGSNVLMLVHLLMIAFHLYKTITKNSEKLAIGKAIVMYIPVYLVWVAIVLFLFPFIFDFQ